MQSATLKVSRSWVIHSSNALWMSLAQIQAGVWIDPLSSNPFQNQADGIEQHIPPFVIGGVQEAL